MHNSCQHVVCCQCNSLVLSANKGVLVALDLSYPQTDDPEEAQFLHDQHDHEIFKGHFSHFSHPLPTDY